MRAGLKSITVLTFIVLSISLSSCSGHLSDKPKVERGQYTIISDQIEKRNIDLDGNWEFYNQALLSPADFNNEENLPKMTCFLPLPSPWTKNISPELKMNGQGFGTYRIKVINPDKASELGLYVKNIVSSYRLYVNGVEQGSNGVPGTDKQNTIPESVPKLITFSSDTSAIEIILQVSNFHQSKGGPISSITIGKTENLVRKASVMQFFDILLLGSMLIMALFHIGMFFYFRKGHSPLLFGIFCLLISIRILITSEQFINVIFPGINWFILFRVEFLSFVLAPVFLLAFFRKLFPFGIHKNIAVAYYVCGAILSLAALFLSSFILSRIFEFYQIIVAFLGIILLNGLVKTIKKDFEGSMFFLIGGLIIFATLLNDILYNRGIIQSNAFFSVSLFLFIFFESFALWAKYARTYKLNEVLTNQLNRQKENLETIVSERTSELQLRNEEVNRQKNDLEDLNKHLAQQAEDLQAQSEMLETVNILLEQEKKRSEKLLLNILPRRTANELKKSGKAKTKFFSDVSVMFTDFKDFSRISEILTPEELIRELDYCFAAFDTITLKYGIEKIKTMGDSYLGVSGLNNEAANHTLSITLAAMEIQSFMHKYMNDKKAVGELYFDNKIGIHTGDIISGVVGKTKFSFDIWGPTVNIASRMQSSCEPGKINISESTKKKIEPYFIFTSRGKITAKHQQELNMYYIDRILPEFCEDENGLVPNQKLLRKAGFFTE